MNAGDENEDGKEDRGASERASRRAAVDIRRPPAKQSMLFRRGLARAGEAAALEDDARRKARRKRTSLPRQK